MNFFFLAGQVPRVRPPFDGRTGIGGYTQVPLLHLLGRTLFSLCIFYCQEKEHPGGRFPIDEPFTAAADCGKCHEKEHREWSTSAHALAFSNPRFQAAYRVEPQSWCINCHAPLKAQATEQRMPTELTQDGVNCAACHVKAGAIVASRPSLYTIPGLGQMLAPHATGVHRSLASSESCVHCHEFPFPASHDPVVYSDVPMQSTFSEHKLYGQSSRFFERRCQGCHFPDGSHSLPGPLQSEWMQKRIKIEFRLLQARKTETGSMQAVARIRIAAIGHAFPTGDLFRSVDLRAFKKGEEVGRYRLLRHVRVVDRKLIHDSRLLPVSGKIDQEVSFPVSQNPDRCLVSYHYQGAIEQALTGRLKPEELSFVLYDGPCRQTGVPADYGHPVRPLTNGLLPGVNGIPLLGIRAPAALPTSCGSSSSMDSFERLPTIEQAHPAPECKDENRSAILLFGIFTHKVRSGPGQTTRMSSS